MRNIRKLLVLILFQSLGSYLLMAQAPQGINYQAVARNPSGELLASTAIEVEFSLRANGTTGVIEYSESHAISTNSYGLFSLIIGQGSPIVGLFEDLDWNVETYFLEVSIDGSSINTTQLVSVPYALAVAPRKQYYSIPGAVFTLNNTAGSFYSSVGQGGAEITQTGGVVVNILNAPVNLPHGAKIEKFTIFFRDESAAQDLNIALNRENLNSGVFSRVIDITTSGDSTGWRSESIEISHTVNNLNFGYFIRVFCIDWDAEGSKAIKGALIEYTY